MHRVVDGKCAASSVLCLSKGPCGESHHVFSVISVAEGSHSCQKNSTPHMPVNTQLYLLNLSLITSEKKIILFLNEGMNNALNFDWQNRKILHLNDA